jgi:hypothetical protein
MTQPDKAWKVRLEQNGEQGISRARNRPIVTVLTLLTVVLALVGLLIDLQFGSRAIAAACYAAAVLSGLAVMAFLFIKRLWSPRRHS